MEHTKSTRRAWRRHHRDRLKAVRAGYYGNAIAQVPAGHRARFLGRVLSTPKPCSCLMCGNPRTRLSERTRQEEVADHVLDEALACWWEEGSTAPCR